DARRCISYLTIEHKGWVDRALRPLMGNWVYGCDICQDVCPWQRFILPTSESGFMPSDVDRIAPLLIELLRLDEATFRQRFAGSAIIRIKRDRLVRNACIAAGNWRNEVVVPELIHLLDDPAPVVRGHAAWALWQIAGDDIDQMLKRHHEQEIDAEVREELDYLLNQSGDSDI
ncbi:MAG TPA: 4Fe-4S double cluster binding domain-containing protein, partial [Phototrophicaceae bacterium]|nr:4Fe-4S double cluster binding domain-containing protein [Phototrophicaceae bacterium]